MQYIFLVGITAAVIGLTAGMILLTIALIKPVGKINVRTSGLILMGSLFLAVACVTGLMAISR
jgi:hypothetical protein